MYPYNRNTQLYHTPLQTKERITQQKQKNQPSLSTDRRLHELLHLARQEATVLEQKYAALQESEPLAEATTILKNMEIDAKKHQRILRELLFEIFEDAFEEMPEELTETETEEQDAEALLENLLFTELDDIPFFRSLLAAMEDEELWELLFEVLTDKQNHAAALNHLYAKYFAKTSGN